MPRNPDDRKCDVKICMFGVNNSHLYKKPVRNFQVLLDY